MTAYDTDYSTNVPLSRILDALLDDNEKPDIVIAFLDLHSDVIKCILSNSLSFMKMFQLDFALKCSLEYFGKLLSILQNEAEKNCWMSNAGKHLAWQILGSNSAKADTLKYAFRAELNKLLCLNAMRHPYRYGGRLAESFDKIISSYCVHDDVVNQIASWPVEDLRRYCSNISWSLFKYRTCQYDVFSALSEVGKYIMLKSLNACIEAEDLYFQILTSDECVDVKSMALESLRILDYEYAEGSATGEILKCTSFSQMQMTAAVMGEFDVWRTIAIELLRSRRLDVLSDWLKSDRVGLESCTHATDLIEHEIEKHNSKKKKH